jgi:acyl-CoA thioesterase-1
MQSDMNFFSKQNRLSRRHCIAATIGLALMGLNHAGGAVLTAEKPKARILVVGDSLSAEYGLKRGTGWVALLEKKLATEKISANVVNASISGDTTSGGRARLPALLTKHRPTLVVIELGGNDAIRGLPLAQTQDNLMVMINVAQKANAKVLLLGMQVPPNYGQSYALAFSGMYRTAAKSSGAALVPFLLKGIADSPDSMKWFQADRIHPTEEAHPHILANVWPELKKGLQ